MPTIPMGLIGIRGYETWPEDRLENWLEEHIR